MAANKKQVENPQELENFENAVLTSEAFIEKNQKPLMIAFVAILVVLTGWLMYKNLYQIPNNQEAEALMVAGQAYFSADKYDVALNGDSIDFIGFVAIADEYSHTPSGNLANAYAGLANYKLGNYDDAIAYLAKFGTSDDVLGNAIVGTIGDCYVQKGDVNKALSYFKDAANSQNTMVACSYLLKLARAYENLGDTNNALATYQKIDQEYKGVLPGMSDVDDVEKFIGVLQK